MWRKISLPALIIMAFLCFGIPRAEASDWPAPNYNTSNNNYISDPSILNAKEANPKYIDQTTTFRSQIIVEDVLFTVDGPNQDILYAYELNSLALKWSKSFGRAVANLAYENGTIYVAAGDIVALNAENGELRWTFSIVSNMQGKLYQAAGGKIYCAIHNPDMAYFQVLDEANGLPLLQNKIAFTNYITDVTLSPSKIYINYGKFWGNGSYVEAYDINDYHFIAKSPVCRSSDAKAMYDQQKDTLYLTAGNGALYAYSGETLLQLNAGWTAHLSRFVRYGNYYYSAYGRSVQYLSAGNTAFTSNIGDVLNYGTTFSADPIIVNGVIYATTSKGQLWAKNLETEEVKSFTIDPNYYISKIIYGGGHFVMYGVSGNARRLWIYNFANLSMTPVKAGVSVYSPYKTHNMNQYLGQTHAHIVPEREIDPVKVLKNSVTAADVVLRYRDAGYDFVALTEHNKILSDPFVQRVLHIQSEEDTQGSGGNHILALGISRPIDETKSDQERIDAVVNQGGVPILAHPNSRQYSISLNRLKQYSNYRILEIYNNAINTYRGAYLIVGDGLSVNKWDALLAGGQIIFGDAGDDYTPYDGGFDGAAISVFSPSNNSADILSNIKAGNFYALEGSQAPRITGIEVTADHVSLATNELCHIDIIGKGGKILKSESNATGLTYTIQGEEIYVRAEIKSMYTGKRAWSQPVFISRPLQVDASGEGAHDLYLDQAMLTANTSGDVSAATLDRADYPSSNPPSGYLSPVYRFSTSGAVNQDTKVSISYANKSLLSKAENLSVYYYNENSGNWEKVASSVDEANKLVTADLTHFSLYTLSASIPVDTTPPSIVLVGPDKLNNLMGDVEFTVNANDDQAVLSVGFYMDGKFIDNDSIIEDGWSASTNLDNTIVGNHKLTITAEDAAGNIVVQDLDIFISSGLAAPTLTLNVPSEGSRAYGSANITGSYTSVLPVNAIDAYLDGVWIKSVVLNGGSFSEEVDWDNFTEGDHNLKLILSDSKGNQEVLQRSIRVGNKVEASIISPLPISHLRNNDLLVSVIINPIDSNVEIDIDGQPVANNQNLDLLSFPLGEHTLSVKYEGEVIAATSFNIITSYADTRDTVWRMYGEGKIKNRGIAEAICAHLTNAEVFHKSGLYVEERKTIELLIKFIDQQVKNRQTKIEKMAGYLIEENLRFLITS